MKQTVLPLHEYM